MGSSYLYLKNCANHGRIPVPADGTQEFLSSSELGVLAKSMSGAPSGGRASLLRQEFFLATASTPPNCVILKQIFSGQGEGPALRYGAGAERMYLSSLHIFEQRKPGTVSGNVHNFLQNCSCF